MYGHNMYVKEKNWGEAWSAHTTAMTMEIEGDGENQKSAGQGQHAFINSKRIFSLLLENEIDLKKSKIGSLEKKRRKGDWII